MPRKNLWELIITLVAHTPCQAWVMVTLQENHLNQHRIPVQLGLQFRSSGFLVEINTQHLFALQRLLRIVLHWVIQLFQFTDLDCRAEEKHCIGSPGSQNAHEMGQYLHTTDSFWVLSGDLGRDSASENIIHRATKKLTLPVEVLNIKPITLCGKVDRKKSEETKYTDKRTQRCKETAAPWRRGGGSFSAFN